jgi:hypothetical protein
MNPANDPCTSYLRAGLDTPFERDESEKRKVPTGHTRKSLRDFHWTSIEDLWVPQVNVTPQAGDFVIMPEATTHGVLPYAHSPRRSNNVP